MIEYKQIEKANSTIKATNLKGKDYAEVNQRIKAFRMCYPNGTISTEIVSLENGLVLMKAFVKNDEEKLIGTGYAYEKENSTFVNQTSYIENCETSAVGRALGMCGFGIDVSVASLEEVQNAIANQQGQHQEPVAKSNNSKVIKATAKQIEVLTSVYKDVNLKKLLKVNGIEKLEDISVQKASELIKVIKEKEKQKNGRISKN